MNSNLLNRCGLTAAHTRRNFAIVAALFAVCFIFSASGVSAATFVVNSTTDANDATAGDGICATAGGVCTLRAAISEANALAGDDIITLPAGTYTNTLVGVDDANASGDLDITSNIVINGAGSGTTIIQANANPGVAVERVIHFPTANSVTTFNGVTIRNGRQPTATFGGGVRINAAGDAVTFNNCIITNNFSGFGGGGIIVNSPTASLTLNNTSVTNNQAAPSTGTTQGLGGGIFLNGGGTLIATDSSISSNTASSAGGNALGGGIYNPAGTITLTNTTVNGNLATTTGTAAAFGGGIATTGASIANISGGSVSNNTANSTGGAAGLAAGIYNEQSILTITNSSVSGNTASSFHGGIRALAQTFPATTNITNSTISNNSAPGEGGGVINFSIGAANSIVTVTGSAIVNNSSSGATSVGGGVENVSNAAGLATVNLNNSTVGGNSAASGAGTYNFGANSAINLNYSTVASNTAATSGGGLFQDATGTTNLMSSIVADNTAPTGPDIAGTITSANYNHIEDTSGGTFVPLLNDVTGTDPNLGPLALNGGTTLNYAPQVGSPVIDTIPNGVNGCGVAPFDVDQRGMARPTDSNSDTVAACEKGAVEVLAPSAAGVSVSGRVFNGASNGNKAFGIANAVVTLVDQNGNTRVSRTNSFGYYKFDDLEVGQTYTFYISARRYQFATQVFSLTNAVTNLNFSPIE